MNFVYYLEEIEVNNDNKNQNGQNSFKQKVPNSLGVLVIYYLTS